MNYIKQLLELNHSDLALAGGKGANLGALIAAGMPVPGGFCITTDGYRAFVIANRLQEVILQSCQAIRPDNPADLEAASTEIRAHFHSGTLPPAVVAEIIQAYASLSAVHTPVAIRSSATTEDLPELSFAGQHDTYLNIVGEDPLLKAVVHCWASLWTARAIGYRARNILNTFDEMALAVIVQQMIASEASGVLFTANPLTGLRSETVIDATLGLGEALVSGQVEPDHYEIEPSTGHILHKKLGAKSLAIHGLTGGGTRMVNLKASDQQALPDEAILALAQLGQLTAAVFGSPQDIEWAWAGAQLYLLQSRPITSLFPLPDGLPVEPLKVFFSFAAVQGMLDPITPLGRDSLRQIFASGAGLFGIRVTPETQSVLFEAGERLWVNFTSILSNSIGRKVVPVVLGLVEPTIRQAVNQIKDDPRLQPGSAGISFHARTQLARFVIPLGLNVILNMISPRRRREYIVNNGDKVLLVMKTHCDAIQGSRYEKLAQQANLLRDLAGKHFPNSFRLFISAVAAGMASWNFLNMLAGNAAKHPGVEPGTDTHDLILQLTRAMPFNPTTEMDLALWEMAKTIRSDAPSWLVFQQSNPSELTQRFLAGSLPQIASQTIDRFLSIYGGRGLGEIDLGRTRWADDPTHVFEMLASFLQINDETQAPDIVFERGRGAAREAITRLAGAVRKTKGGWFKARLVHFFAGRARQLMGARESPKFFAVRMMWLIHRELLETGAEFVETGELDKPDDLFYLTLNELRSFASQQEKGWRKLIASRRQSYQRELLRRQIPRLLLSDGRAFYEGIYDVDPSANSITGSPVSPGSVHGKVRVVLDPRQAHLLPGEILVCPGTDPSWTPLFLSAGGLIMETGGMMTHGSVVAREYGIPAVVGVTQATTRLKTGQLIRLNGSSGMIVILEDENPPA
jgi:phosphohistidine swiveling domain-containing protein